MGALKRQLLIGIAISLAAPVAHGDQIYYAVSEGHNYEKQIWHAGDLKEFNRKRPNNVFDLYTFQRLTDGSVKVARELSAPSGDWFLRLTYFYGKNGQLTKIDFDFSTFEGKCSCGEGGLTRCQRSYSVDSTGQLRKRTERVTDMKTGDIVDWTFPEPKVKHWASLHDLPMRPH
jgi:hypothetical protein